MEGIANVSFAGGGIILPARSPYDWENLAEHVDARARLNGRLLVRIDNRSWSVYPTAGTRADPCARCGHTLGPACYSAQTHGEAYCVKCAFRQATDYPHQRREAG